jgi:hypothetical protein
MSHTQINNVELVDTSITFCFVEDLLLRVEKNKHALKSLGVAPVCVYRAWFLSDLKVKGLKSA